MDEFTPERVAGDIVLAGMGTGALVEKVRALQAENEQLEARLAKAREALEAVELIAIADTDEGYDWFCCPWCYGSPVKSWEEFSHAPDCQRQAALKEAAND